jgi:hypothetical protein
VEEVARQHRGGLGAQELAPGRAAALRCGRDPQPLHPLPQLPPGADPGDPETWRIEDLVFDLCVPKTYANWAYALRDAVGSVTQTLSGGQGLSSGWRAMIFGLWA